MQRLRLTAALLLAAMAAPVLAQNVQNRQDPQNPADVTAASPAGQGATEHLQDRTTIAAPKQSAAMSRYQHQAMHARASVAQHHKRADID